MHADRVSEGYERLALGGRAYAPSVRSACGCGGQCNRAHSEPLHVSESQYQHRVEQSKYKTAHAGPRPAHAAELYVQYISEQQYCYVIGGMGAGDSTPVTAMPTGPVAFTSASHLVGQFTALVTAITYDRRAAPVTWSLPNNRSSDVRVGNVTHRQARRSVGPESVAATDGRPCTRRVQYR